MNNCIFVQNIVTFLLEVVSFALNVNWEGLVGRWNAFKYRFMIYSQYQTFLFPPALLATSLACWSVSLIATTLYSSLLIRLWSLVPNTKCSSSGDSRVCSPSSSSDHSHNYEGQQTKLTEPGGNICVSKGNPSPWTLAAINKNKYNIIMSMQIRYNTTDGRRKPETKYKCWPPTPGDKEMRAAERKHIPRAKTTCIQF